jgi:hypothetical protein
LNKRLNGYELGFESGLSPNELDVGLLGWILANGLVERVRTRQPDRPTAAGVLGLGWAARTVCKAGQAGLTHWVSAQEPISNKNFFFFFKSIL